MTRFSKFYIGACGETHAETVFGKRLQRDLPDRQTIGHGLGHEKLFVSSKIPNQD